MEGKSRLGGFLRLAFRFRGLEWPEKLSFSMDFGLGWASARWLVQTLEEEALRSWVATAPWDASQKGSPAPSGLRKTGLKE